MTTRNVHPSIARRKDIIARWRALKLPRLYWKQARRQWRWDSNVIARTKDHMFTSLESVETFLDVMEGKPAPEAETPQPIRRGRG